LYVSNTGTNSITVYHQDATGNTSPFHIIAGPHTGIDSPGQLAEDNAGNLFVANGSYSKISIHPGILVFAHGANGDVAPVRTLAGPITGIHNIEGMTIDPGTGNIFVVDLTAITASQGNVASLLRFGPNANGNHAPYARTAPGLYPAVQIATNSNGQNILEAHVKNAPSSALDGIATYPSEFTANVLPTYSTNTTWLTARGVADDPTSGTYLTTTGLDCAGCGGIYLARFIIPSWRSRPIKPLDLDYTPKQSF